MKKNEALFLAAELQRTQDMWSNFTVHQKLTRDGYLKDEYCVKRTRFCMVEIVYA
jgi:hypothetical protein